MNPKLKLLFLGTLLLAQSSLAMAGKDLLNIQAEGDEWLAYSSVTSQAALGRSGNLGEAVVANSVVGQSATTMGFAEKSPEARSFLAGALYAEALALTRDGQYQEASKRLKALIDLSVKLAVSPALNQYLYRVNHMLIRKSHDRSALVDLMSLAQPFLDQHMGAQSKEMRFLFQTGSWLADYGMAAAMGSYEFLQQPFILGLTLREMQRLEAPKGVIDALQEIKGLTSRKDVGEREARQVQRLVKKMQELLG